MFDIVFAAYKRNIYSMFRIFLDIALKENNIYLYWLHIYLYIFIHNNVPNFQTHFQPLPI